MSNETRTERRDVRWFQDAEPHKVIDKMTMMSAEMLCQTVLTWKNRHSNDDDDDDNDNMMACHNNNKVRERERNSFPDSISQSFYLMHS